MDFELIPATEAEAHVFVNLWPLYQYDLSEVGGMPVNADGLFEDEGIREHDYMSDLRVWFRRPGHLFPFLIRVDGRAAGFAMIGGAPSNAPKDRDFLVQEMFLMRPFRGLGVAEGAMRQVFARLPGLWEIWVIPENSRALAFWRKVVGELTDGQYTEARQYIDLWDSDCISIRFECAQ